MVETEILVEVFDSLDDVQNSLSKYEYCGVKHVIDTYFYDPLRTTLKPNINKKLYACFRIRQKGNLIFITYKDDHYTNGVWEYSDEYEIKVDNYDTACIIMKKLGLKELLIIDSMKYFYKFKDYEIVVELVKNLGTFLEVELKRDIFPSQVIEYKKGIRKFIKSLELNISDELNAGKPELFIQKNSINIK